MRSPEEAAEEERRAAARAASGSNATPLLHVDERKSRNAKRLSSPERFEIKQLIASGAVNAADVSAECFVMPDVTEPSSIPTSMRN